MEIKDLISIILGILALVSFIIFMRSAQDITNFTTAIWSCLVTAVLVAIILVLNPWLVGKK
ncbi:hypothetical protein COU57_01895 [Candidatus Pacearchaeota archaeon CG10_big_fil_rev_8_21_14_0_10_32_14]|nr:MAG: hypothetical protein COU57_01895 [Candidatus Pacearchaeota archaeon CG10_big_fil_rev_8_21_14_0_10_32_14]